MRHVDEHRQVRACQYADFDVDIYRKVSPWLACDIRDLHTSCHVTQYVASNQDFESVRRGCVSTPSADDAGRGPWPWPEFRRTGRPGEQRTQADGGIRQQGRTLQAGDHTFELTPRILRSLVIRNLSLRRSFSGVRRCLQHSAVHRLSLVDLYELIHRT
jgi:hypothetical protein